MKISFLILEMIRVLAIQILIPVRQIYKKSPHNMKPSPYLFVFLIILPVFLSQILEPSEIKDLMYTNVITGIPDIAIPVKTNTRRNEIVGEVYRMQMVKTCQKMLPGNYPNTTVYVYQSMTKNGVVSSFPAPAIIAKKGVPVTVTWANKIKGKHILPVEYNHPFMDDDMFRLEVPTVTHLHGGCNPHTSDGLPERYYTASGKRAEMYTTQQPCKGNEAVYRYPNDQDPGIHWFHDHTMGLTRLNVYAGLAGLYEIVQNNQSRNCQIKSPESKIEKFYGKLERLYFVVADKTFYKSGELYYPDKALSSEFTTWVPEFFGNTITVNGKVWPKVQLRRKIYRMVFLNACNSRFLNIYFIQECNNQKVPFKLVRLEGDYFAKQVKVEEYLLSPATRLQIIIDLTDISGDVILKNNAHAPHPIGVAENLVDEFTGSIMKIQLAQQYIKTGRYQKKKQDYPIVLKENAKYPQFWTGKPVYQVLTELMSMDDGSMVGMLIGGASMMVSQNCTGSTYELGKVYDVHLINLTPDTHPIHYHLINFQKVFSFPINVEAYRTAWHLANGGEPPMGGYKNTPKTISPEPYRTGPNELPRQEEKIFRDVTNASPGMVTVFRIKFSKNDGSPFGFNAANSRFVWHCHMLEHEDNEMMKYYCLKKP